MSMEDPEMNSIIPIISNRASFRAVLAALVIALVAGLTFLCVPAVARGGGGGGRIAVWSVRNRFTGTASVAGATGYQNGTTGTIVWGTRANPGTIMMMR